MKTGKLPSSMTLSSSGLLFVLNAESHTVSVIDIEKEKIYVRFLYLIGLLGFILMDSLFGSAAMVNKTLNKSIFAYDPKTGKKQREIKLGVMPVAFFQRKILLLYMYYAMEIIRYTK